ncbi:hypothetical protein Glove_346g145 [Diversispora epigaea]|uniref:Uncharacterized protein n=1 Tax=Diversispora epigaea TaxID=1348612 RepID=A0A397HK80_9GLOM|nr:hypothetical protein Glove_346g145 [Diversispora epigaea]
MHHSSKKSSDVSEVSEIGRTYNNNGNNEREEREEADDDDDNNIGYNKDHGEIMDEGGVISTNPQGHPIFNLRDPTDKSLVPTVKTVPSEDDKKLSEEENKENKGKSKSAPDVKDIGEGQLPSPIKTIPPIITSTPITTSPTSIISSNPFVPTSKGYTSKMIEQLDLIPSEKQLMSPRTSSNRSKKGLFSGSRSSKKKSKDSSGGVVGKSGNIGDIGDIGGGEGPSRSFSSDKGKSKEIISKTTKDKGGGNNKGDKYDKDDDKEDDEKKDN